MAYVTGFKESNMAEKLNSYANAEIIGFLPKPKNLICLNVQITIHSTNLFKFRRKPFQPSILQILIFIIMWMTKLKTWILNT